MIGTTSNIAGLGKPRPGRIFRNLLLASVVVATVLLLVSSEFGGLGPFGAWAQEQGVLAVSVFAVGIFSLRRWTGLGQDANGRARAEAALGENEAKLIQIEQRTRA